MKNVDIAVIGGGAAGMAAAVSARKRGVKNIVIIERSGALGGVLHQCIHNGFGLHRFGEDLTGVEFAQKYADMVEEEQIPYMLNSFVIDLSADRVLTVVSPDEGLVKIQAKAVILAMGCRERSRNALLIPGTRGAGILTAGTAQRYLNIDGYLPGRKVVILGSGDIGLIMARQFMLEGIEVCGVVEIMPYSSGLPRNMKQCIEDFDIPVWYNSTVTKIEGRERVRAVQISRVDENRRPIPGTMFRVECDTLMISAGLIPENELTEAAGIEMCPATKGAEVTEDNMTSIPGVFACGNVLHVHDLVDFVSEEGERTGAAAADYISTKADSAVSGQDLLYVENLDGVGGIVPQKVRRSAEGKVRLMFRPRAKFRDVKIVAEAGGDRIFERKCIALTPGEMCEIDVPADKIPADAGSIRVKITEA